MSRPRRDGRTPRATRKSKLSDALVRSLQAESAPYLVWDKKLEGFAVQVQPTGHKAFKCIYRMNGNLRWLTIGSIGKIDFDNARPRKCGEDAILPTVFPIRDEHI
jgi:hypothetical protein